jgi:hypothetical protein
VDVRGGRRLAGVGADPVQLRQERPLRAEHGLDGQRRGHVRHGEQVAGVLDGEQQHAEHPVGAVDQREAFLGGEVERAQAGVVQGLRGGGTGTVLAEHPALAEQHQRAVRQRCQVAGRAQRAVFRHPRRDVRVQQVGDALGEHRAYPGVAEGQRAQPQQQHGPHHFAGHRRADPGGVRADQRVLQLGPPFGGDERVGERAEAGGHAVHRAAGGLDGVDYRAAAGHRGDGGFGYLHPGGVAGNGEDVGGGDAGGFHDDGHRGAPWCRTVLTRGTPGR